MTFGEAMRKVRMKKGLTQKELAAALGTKAAVICRYEAGKIAPTIIRAQEIADALEVPIERLLGKKKCSS